MSLTQALHSLYDEYREGRFPMAETADGPAMIITPRERALLPIRDLHISRSLMKTVRAGRFEVRVDTAFDEVVEFCAEATVQREETWINPDIKFAFHHFHQMGLAHSVECWQEDRLVGGLYGLQVGGAFCGESMFSRVTDASKVALIHLCARLNQAGFTLLDAQYHNAHLSQFGLITLSQREYVKILKNVRDQKLDFTLSDSNPLEHDLVVSYLNNRAVKA
jgi:leucyl/phenylalanyl-tRNA--protein transferase